MRLDLPQRLDSIKRDLDKLAERIKTVGQRELDSFSEKVAASVNRDSTLTEQARNATETVEPWVLLMIYHTKLPNSLIVTFNFFFDKRPTISQFSMMCFLSYAKAVQLVVIILLLTVFSNCFKNERNIIYAL